MDRDSTLFKAYFWVKFSSFEAFDRIYFDLNIKLNNYSVMLQYYDQYTAKLVQNMFLNSITSIAVHGVKIKSLIYTSECVILHSYNK